MHKIAIPQAAVDRVLRRRGSLHAFDDIDPSRTAHLVVDLQNGFMAPGQPVEIPTARAIVPNVNRISAALRTAGGLVVYLQNTIDQTVRDTWSNWYDHMAGKRFRDTLVRTFAEGSDGHALWSGLDVTHHDLKVRKTRYSAFVPGASELHAILQSRGIDTVIVSGTATDVCCEATARDAMMMNYKVIFVSDATATHSDAEHNAALGIIVAQFADVMTTDEVLKCLSPRAARAAE